MSDKWESTDFSDEKARIENRYIDEEEKLARWGESYLKEIERAKFHEERGKVNCNCHDCETNKEKIKKDIADYDRQSRASDKEKCLECSKLRLLDEEARVCKSCVKKYE